VLRQFLTSGDDSFDQRFPRIFVLDRAIAGTGSPTRRPTATGDTLIPPAARHAITGALTDVGPVAFVSSPDAVIVDRHGCARVRDQGILVTLGPLIGIGDRVEVGLNGFVACLGAAWMTYRVGWTGKGWIVHETIRGASRLNVISVQPHQRWVSTGPAPHQAEQPLTAVIGT
jgi:hypothetical protein